MSRRMSVVLAAFLLIGGTVALWGRPSALAQTRPAAKEPGLFINLTSGKEDLHAVSMGLGLAGNALKEGHEVVVFLNVHAPIFAAGDLSEEVKIADFPPVKTLVADVVSRGGKVLVCSHCADCCRVDRTKLVPGVTATTHTGLLQQLRPGMVGISY